MEDGCQNEDTNYHRLHTSIKSSAMRVQSLLPLASMGSLVGASVSIVAGNDDGWAEMSIRTFYSDLKAAGYDVLLSAPAEPQSSVGDLDLNPIPLVFDTCQFDSCPKGSPAIGHNETDPKMQYVHSTPVAAMRIGIGNFTNGGPDLAVTGPNTMPNWGLAGILSGTEQAAAYAAKHGIPALAFSGWGKSTAWNKKPPSHDLVYAAAATNFTSTIVDQGKPYLPDGILLNINYGPVTDYCNSSEAFKYVMARQYPALPIVTKHDVSTCGRDRLPLDVDVIPKDLLDKAAQKDIHCLATVSVIDARTVTDANATMQKAVMDKLDGMLTCLTN